jgi:serine/threonine-protein kinase
LRDPQSVDLRIDIYSLGAVAFFLLVGCEVFESETVADALFQVMNVEPRRPSALRPGIPMELDQLVVDCLAKQPEDRPESVRQVLARLNKASLP